MWGLNVVPLLHPTSERETAIWGKELSGLDELLGTCFEHLANNLELIRSKGFHYLTVNRRKPVDMPSAEDLEIIKQDRNGPVRVKKIDLAEGALVYCESSARALKEHSMKTRFQGYYEAGLKEIAASLTKKRGLKKYGKVMERLGRLHEKYPTIAGYYQLDVQHDGDTVKGLTWKIDREEELRSKFAGNYYLRSSRSDLDAKELWSLYMMLT